MNKSGVCGAGVGFRPRIGLPGGVRNTERFGGTSTRLSEQADHPDKLERKTELTVLPLVPKKMRQGERAVNCGDR